MVCLHDTTRARSRLSPAATAKRLTIQTSRGRPSSSYFASHRQCERTSEGSTFPEPIAPLRANEQSDCEQKHLLTLCSFARYARRVRQQRHSCTDLTCEQTS